MATSSKSTSISDLEKPTEAPDHIQPTEDSQTSIPLPEEEEKKVFKPTTGFVLAFASICVVTLASAIDATSLSIALPIVTVALKGGAIDAFWSGTSFLIASAVAMPVAGGLSHVFGRKQVSRSRLVKATPADLHFHRLSSLLVFSLPLVLSSLPWLQTLP